MAISLADFRVVGLFLRVLGTSKDLSLSFLALSLQLDGCYIMGRWTDHRQFIR